MLEVKTNIRSTDKSMAPNEKTRTAFHSVLAILVWIAHSSFPGIKRSKTEIKASFLVHLRQVFFFCFFNPTINVQVGNEEPQTMLHTTTAHFHYQQNLYWWVRKNTVCFKIKKKRSWKTANSVTFENLVWYFIHQWVKMMKLGLMNVEITGVFQSVGDIFNIPQIQLLVSIIPSVTLVREGIYSWVVGWLWVQMVNYL